MSVEDENERCYFTAFDPTPDQKCFQWALVDTSRVGSLGVTKQGISRPFSGMFKQRAHTYVSTQ